MNTIGDVLLHATRVKSKTPKPVFWLSPVNACDCCDSPLVKTAPIYDAKTRGGPWGLMCHSCFKLDGIALGTGLGQKYEYQTTGEHAGRWLKVEG